MAHTLFIREFVKPDRVIILSVGIYSENNIVICAGPRLKMGHENVAQLVERMGLF